jgi:uncharacterized protein YndB with AHSA1/START domain
MLKKIVISILAILFALLAYAFFAEKKMNIVSEIVINKPRTLVFEYTRNLHNQEKWSKWVMTDPEVKLTYSGTDGQVGSKAAWQSDIEEVGVGEQEIIKINVNNSIEQQIRFKKPFEGISQAITIFDSLGANQTKITTTFNSENPFPVNLMNPFVKKMLKKDMDQNSANLKGQLEK